MYKSSGTDRAPGVHRRALPLHAQISADLRRGIQSGDLPVGTRLHSEADLMARYGVARGTVRQALAALRADGLVAGGRGAPPVVRRPQLAQPFSELLSFSAWVGSIGRRPAGRVVEFGTRPAEPEIAAALGVAAGSPVHHLVRVRLADDEPLMIERTSFPPDVGALVAAIDLERDSIYASLAERGVVFDWARQEIDALAASAVDARLLGCAVRTPLLRARRHSFSAAGRPLEWSDDRYLAGRITLAIEHSAARPALVRRLA